MSEEMSIKSKTIRRLEVGEAGSNPGPSKGAPGRPKGAPPPKKKKKTVKGTLGVPLKGSFNGFLKGFL